MHIIPDRRVRIATTINQYGFQSELNTKQINNERFSMAEVLVNVERGLSEVTAFSK